MKKAKIAAHFDAVAERRDVWRRRNSLYHDTLECLCTSFIKPGASALELGCGTGHLLAALKPGRGVGVDLSSEMIVAARRQHPDLEFLVGDAEALALEERFDGIVLSDLVGYLDDIWQTFRDLHRVCHPGSRIVLTLHNWMWQPILRAGERLRLKMPDGVRQNWISIHDVKSLLLLNDFAVEQSGSALVIPAHIPLLSALNRLATSRLLRRFALVQYVVARPMVESREAYKCSVIIPTRNERGNIEGCVIRTPEMGLRTELVFVDGQSTDGTVERIQEMMVQHPERDIKLIHQVPRQPGGNREVEIDATGTPSNLMLRLGKGDAVRKGFAAATGDVLMILDSDLTVPPEELPKFYDALASGKARFINGSRLIYPMPDEAMKGINRLGNAFFSVLFTWLLEQRITDTLCGTKALLRQDYEEIARNRSYFGNMDPFGDFDLLFGACRLGLGLVEVPVHYQARTSGESKVRAFRHGIFLIRVSVIAFAKLKLDNWLRKRKTSGR